MSRDPQQEYFADGMVEDIITALSRFKLLFVIARNSTFTYKGKAVDVKQVGRELGVRYVLEGSVRKAGNRVRITGQLIEAATGTHLWADHFNGRLEDVFDLQDEVTASVVGLIAPKLEQAEIARARRKPTESLDAYDYYLRGMAAYQGATKDANQEALRLYLKAIALDPAFASPYAMAARCYALRRVNGWMIDRATEIAEATRLVRQAVALSNDDAVVLGTAGYILAYVARDLAGGATYVDRARTLNPNLAFVWAYTGWMDICRGRPENAIENVAHAMRLNPVDPSMHRSHFYMAMAHFFAGRNDDAALWAEMVLREQPDHPGALRTFAASHAFAGRIEQAQKAMSRIRQIDPTLRISNLADVLPPFSSEDFARYTEGLRLAGLPE